MPAERMPPVVAYHYQMFKTAILVILLPLTGCSQHDPSDAEMLRNFQQHRAEFEQLREMVSTDAGLQRVDQDWTRPDNPAAIGISAERIAEYRRIFHKLGIPRGFQAYGDRSEIKFIAHAEGLAVAGHAKNYVWSASEPDELVDSIDQFRVDEMKQYRDYLEKKSETFQKHWNVYRRIEGNWYLNWES